MIKAPKIGKFGKLLMMLLAAVVLLSACSNNENNAGRAITNNEVATASEATMPKVDCWQGQVLHTVYEVIGSTVMIQYEKLCQGSMSIMMLGFAIWLAMRLLKFVSSVTESSPAELWNEIVRKAFICLFCGYLAYSPTTLLYLINYLLFPIYGAFLEFGVQILDAAQNAVKDSALSQITVFGQEIHFVTSDMICKLADGAQATLKGFPQEFEDTMSCMICIVADKLYLGSSMALRAMTMDGVIPVLVGLLVWSTFLVVGFGFVFYLVDSIFRFGMIILMLPIFVMAYAFGPTKKWTKIGFTNIMHSAAFMMAFSIIIATVLLAMVSLIGDPANSDIFNPSNPDAHFKQISVATLCLLLIGFLVWGSMNVSLALTSSIIGSHVDAKFQQNLKALGKAVLHIISGGFAWTIKAAGIMDKLKGTKVGGFLNATGSLRDKMHRLAGRPLKGK